VTNTPRIEERITSRRVSLGVRAPRIAVLIHEDADEGTCLSLIETLTQIWGGHTSAIIPTNARVIRPLFRKVLRRHDPDWFVRFPGSFSLSPALEHELARSHSAASHRGERIAPLWPENPAYPLTPVDDALPPTDEPCRVTNPMIEGDVAARLLAHATTGLLSEAMMGRLQRRGVEIIHESRRLAVGFDAWTLGRDLWSWDERSSRAPYPLTLAGVRLARWAAKGGREFPPVVVCGSTLNDFALFWTLRAIRSEPWRSEVFWLPTPDSGAAGESGDCIRLLPGLAEAVRRILREFEEIGSILATSVSVPTEGTASVGRVLTEAIMIRSADDAAIPDATPVNPDDFTRLLPYSVGFWEAENPPHANRNIVQFKNGHALLALDTPKPDAAALSYESNLRWMVDVIIDDLCVPVRPELVPLLIELDGFGTSRVARDGVAYSAVSGVRWVGEPAGASLIRPMLRLPEDARILEELFTACGLTITVSNIGRYEREFVRLVGDLETTTTMLRNRSAVAVLLRFAQPPASYSGTLGWGTTIRKKGYLPLSAIRGFWADPDEAEVEAWVDGSLEGGLLQRGLLIKCPYCLFFDWYAMDELTDRVRCHQCRREHTYRSRSDAVHFRLDALADQALSKDCQFTLLALDHLRRAARRAFHFTWACDVRRREGDDPRGKAWLEIDFAAIVDGTLVLGESKASGALDGRDRQQLRRYRSLMEQIRPDRFLVCTGAATWNAGSTEWLASFSEEIEGGNVDLQTLNGVDLGWPPAVEELQATEAALS
jgi:hypothetical protein